MGILQSPTFPSYSPGALVETYAVFGGMPHYLVSVDPVAGLLTIARWAIPELAGSLFNEVPLQVHLEMQGMDVPLYMRVLHVNAQGAHTRAETAQSAPLQCTKPTIDANLACCWWVCRGPFWPAVPLGPAPGFGSAAHLIDRRTVAPP